MDSADQGQKVISVLDCLHQEQLDSKQIDQLVGVVQAVSTSQAIIEFDVDGIVINANDNFLSALGYKLSEIVGKHHRLFVDAAYANSQAYTEFWRSLKSGQHVSGEFPRRAKSGQTVWIMASYNPVLGADGKPTKFIKVATDITEQKLINADFAGQIAAIGKSQAVIEFSLDGIVLSANDNFLNTLGYSLSEIKGKHHSLFVPDEVKRDPSYKLFWEQLGRGEFVSDQFRRIHSSGKSVWIQASYNPIFDSAGKPCKVVKFATDITEQQNNFEEVMHVLEALASNDLTKRITGEYGGNYERVKLALNRAADTINMALREAASVSDSVAASASQVSAASQELSASSEEQSSAVVEVSASLSETDSQIQANTDNAKLADSLVLDTTNIARDGQEKMNRLTQAMGKISRSSEDISKIIKVIDGIAFQTNLLALNAAVEAARAGQHGKGFAVVAQEVRNLAGRSAKAAQETAGLISDAVQCVTEGVDMVAETEKALTGIFENVVKVKDLVSEITSASEEQTKGIGQINTAMSQVSQVGTSNGQKSVELAEASKTLLALTSQLKNQIGQFTLLEVSDHSLSGELPAGVTPEMFNALCLMLQQQQKAG